MGGIGVKMVGGIRIFPAFVLGFDFFCILFQGRILLSVLDAAVV
jgi:hypothetical protein